ncbi:MAG: hypothetical protein H6839_09910 [Planctomycetes bacterium]|nr:hypothetical protein [Planctomycetota bacterium]
MKRLILSAFLLLLAFPAVLAQDAEPEVKLDPTIKLMDVYAKKGRNWSYRVVDWTRGESPEVSKRTVQVTSYKDGKAKITDETVSDGGNSYTSSSYTVDLKSPSPEQLGYAAAGLTEETLDMGFRKFKCRKHVTKTETLQTTTWVSVDYHPLVVKQLKIASSSTQISKLTWFDAADVDPYQLYRKEGRRWTIRTTSGAGGGKTSTSMEYKVKEVRADGATFTLSVLDNTGKSMFSQDTEMSFSAPAMAMGGGTSSNMEMVTKNCPAGDFQCYHMNDAGFESWTSVYWPGLTVATKMKNYSMDLEVFDLGHDEHQFYRTLGNYYVTSSYTTANGEKKPERTVRVEVTEVTETEATYTMTVTDAAGNETGKDTLKHTFPGEAEEEPAAYAGEIEQMVETPAGTYPALYSVSEAYGHTESWSWNGIVILAKTTVAGADPHTIELTELKME